MSTSQKISSQFADTRILMERLQTSLDSFLAATDVPESAARISSGEGRWSILQVTEHLANAEYSMMKRLRESEANPNPADRAHDAWIEERSVDRSKARNAPEASLPVGRYSSLAEARADFERRRKETIALMQASQQDLRARWVKHPFSEVDGHQLILLLCGHVRRHIAQVNEIKNLPAFQAVCERKVAN